MLTSRTFHIVFVGENHGVGIAPCDIQTRLWSTRENKSV